MTENTLEQMMEEMGHQARQAATALRLAPSNMRQNAIIAMAAEVRLGLSDILAANAGDMERGRAKGLSAAMLDRLHLTEARVSAIADSLDAIAALPDPLGHELESWQQPNGLRFSKVTVPIGVIGMIYESRPNVTADAGALCVKSANAVILRSGSEAIESSRAIHAALQAGLAKAGLPIEAIQLVPVTDRAAVGAMLTGLSGGIDLIIPRGGKSLVARVQSDARVPVLAHLDGICHTYVHSDANADMAQEIVLNAKLRRTGVCGATETVLTDSAEMAVSLASALMAKGCEVRGRGFDLDGVVNASDEDFRTEHLDAIVNMAVVGNVDAAVAHIATNGSGHTDAIITDHAEVARRFLNEVDSAIVMHNASTQFADGGEFGFGAEIGIATGRLHARGPVGAQHLVTYKYQVSGGGQVRP